jgi:hypothetical protein
MKTADARETALRQMGALDQLVEIIKELSGPREFRGMTPDEQRVIGLYQTARFNVGQAADKEFPGSPAPSTDTPYRYSRWDGRFGVEGIQTFKLLLPPAIKAEFDRLVKEDNAKC